MSITERAVRNPAGVAVAVAIVVLFGLFSLGKLPVQPFPDIDLPQLGIQANWRAASPREVESEILEPMEEVLQGLPGLQVMEANAFSGGAYIGLQFSLGTDMQATLMDVIGRLNRLPPLPADADPPIVQLGGGGTANAALTWFFVQKLPGTSGELTDYARQVTDIIKPRIESIDGVAGVEILAGAPEQLEIVIDPYRAAVDEQKTSIAKLAKVTEADETAKALDTAGAELEMLIDVVSNLKIDDATQTTAIIENISAIYSTLNAVRAELKNKRQTLAKAEGSAQFGAQMKLLGQAVVNFLTSVTTRTNARNTSRS